MGRLMAIDYGDSRVGISVSDLLNITAQGVTTVYNRGYAKLMPDIKEQIDAYSPEKIVVGLPKNMNATLGERAERTYEFIEELKKIYDGEIVLWDERLTTVSAIHILNETNTRGKNRKKVIDTVAASLILENYMQSMPKK